MLCQNCQERPASIHTVLIAGGIRQEVYLCSECARKRGMPFNKMPFVIQLITSSPAKFTEAKSCPNCGSSLVTLKEKGLLGCSHCYRYLRDELEPIIKRVQGNTLEHVGRRPVSYRKEIEAKEVRDEVAAKLEELNKQLQLVIEREEYEQAAVIRDQIRALKAEGGGRDEGK